MRDQKVMLPVQRRVLEHAVSLCSAATIPTRSPTAFCLRLRSLALVRPAMFPAMLLPATFAPRTRHVGMATQTTTAEPVMLIEGVVLIFNPDGPRLSPLQCHADSNAVDLVPVGHVFKEKQGSLDRGKLYCCNTGQTSLYTLIVKQ